MIEHAPGIFNDRISTLLLEWNEQVNNPALAKLMEGSITPEEFCRRLDEGIAKAKADPNLVIPEYVPYDPTKFGEQP
jgi:hypothetical protein